ncbi:hypothetical protein pipiens_000307, partial [Culex pipiens pipiens]
MTNNVQDFLSFRAENVVLPKNGHFGLLAATGGLADDYDVLHFLTTSLHIPGQGTDEVPANHDQAKLTQEFEDYQKILEQQKKKSIAGNIRKSSRRRLKRPRTTSGKLDDMRNLVNDMRDGMNQVKLGVACFQQDATTVSASQHTMPELRRNDGLPGDDYVALLVIVGE